MQFENEIKQRYEIEKQIYFRKIILIICSKVKFVLFNDATGTH